MLETNTMFEREENQERQAPVYHIFRSVSKLVFHPGSFYEELSRERGYTTALVFLFSCSIIFSILAGIFTSQKRGFFTLIFFINAFFMPFITAFILYLVSILMCKRTFTYQTLFGITAYANVTLLVAWIPGLPLIAGLWKFYLIGLGIVKVGRIRATKAFFSLLAAATVMLFLICIAQPIFKQ